MSTSSDCSTTNCGCNPGLARRDFLKLAGIAAVGAALPNLSAIAGPFDAADFAYSLNGCAAVAPEGHLAG